MKKIVGSLVLAVGSAGLSALFGLTVESMKVAAAAGGFGSLFTFYLLHSVGMLKDRAE